MASFRIVAWNANGILQHAQELEIFLWEQKIDVCLVSETHFSKENYLKIKGYKLYHTIHPDNTARGGSAVLIKENIKHFEETNYGTQAIQATAVKICTKTKKFTVTAIYCPPRYALEKNDYLRLFKTLGNHFIIGGDFNAKHTYWGSRVITTKGKHLFEAIKQTKCECQSTGKPTYWPADNNKTPDLIDFFILKGISLNYSSIEDNYDLSSDHSPIILTISETIINKEKPPTLTNKRTDWESFREELEQRIKLNTPLKTTYQLDNEVEQFVVDLQQAAWKNTPTLNKKESGINCPKKIKDMIAQKRRARKRWQHSRAPDDKRRLNTLSQQLKKEIRENKNDTFNDFLRELSDDKYTDYSLWRVTKNLKRPKTQASPIRKEDGTWARENEQKAELFAEHLANIFQPYLRQTAEENIPVTNNEDETPITLVTPAEVSNEITKNISSKKSPGFDLITGQILKELPRKGIVKLTYLINASFRLRYVPMQWKVAEVIMIPKPGKPPNEKTSYRPISLLPTISKLFEKLLLKRLKPIIEEKKVIPNHQFGFRNKHSTIDQVHRITTIIESTLEEKKICSIIFLDVAQAFDRVWHEGLKYKINTSLPKQHSQLLNSYISDRHFRVKHEDSYSEIKEISAGVPQGSVLGPFLYLLYTNDIPDTEETTIATFADDTAIIAVGDSIEETTNKLQAATDKVNNWTKKWRIKLNESKSMHVNFTNKKINHLPIVINQKTLPHGNNAKYLGMTLDAKLKWKEHVKKKKEELNLKFRKMYWLIGRHSELSLHNKLLLYKQVLKPVWTYGVQLWGCTKKSNVLMIQRFQNKILRSIVNAPWYIRNDDIHKDLKIAPIAEEIQRFARKHEERLHQHQNVEMLQILDNSQQVRRLNRVKPFELVV